MIAPFSKFIHVVAYQPPPPNTHTFYLFIHLLLDTSPSVFPTVNWAMINTKVWMCIRDISPNSCGWRAGGGDSLFVGGFSLLTRAKQAFGMQEPNKVRDGPYYTPQYSFGTVQWKV